MPVSSSGSATSSSSPPSARGDRRRSRSRPGGAVDQRQPVEQRGRAHRADHQVLEARLERGAPLQVASRTARRAGSRAARSPMNSVIRLSRLREHDHAGDRAEQQRVVLAVPGLERRGRRAATAAIVTSAGDVEEHRDAERQRVHARARPRRSARVSPGSQIQIVRPIAVSSATAVSAGTSDAPHEAASGTGRPSARSPSRPPARTAARAPCSRCPGAWTSAAAARSVLTRITETSGVAARERRLRRSAMLAGVASRCGAPRSCG